MPNLTSVGIASGVPNSGTGTVSTIDALMADGGQVTIGAKADAKSTATDTTAITAMSVWKQISSSVQALVTNATALGRAAMTSSLPVVHAGLEYETVAASATDQALGATGGTGDLLTGVLIVPATTSPGAVSIKDGAGSAITIFTGGSSSVTNLVPFFVYLGLTSTGGAWKVTTGSNVSAIGIGDFT